MVRGTAGCFEPRCATTETECEKCEKQREGFANERPEAVDFGVLELSAKEDKGIISRAPS